MFEVFLVQMFVGLILKRMLRNAAVGCKKKSKYLINVVKC